MQMICTPLRSNDNRKSRDYRFCSAYNNLIFVVVSMLVVTRHATWPVTRTDTVANHSMDDSAHRPQMLLLAISHYI